MEVAVLHVSKLTQPPANDSQLFIRFTQMFLSNSVLETEAMTHIRGLPYPIISFWIGPLKVPIENQKGLDLACKVTLS